MLNDDQFASLQGTRAPVNTPVHPPETAETVDAMPSEGRVGGPTKTGGKSATTDPRIAPIGPLLAGTVVVAIVLVGMMSAASIWMAEAPTEAVAVSPSVAQTREVERKAKPRPSPEVSSVARDEAVWRGGVNAKNTHGAAQHVAINFRTKHRAAREAEAKRKAHQKRAARQGDKAKVNGEEPKAGPKEENTPEARSVSEPAKSEETVLAPSELDTTQEKKQETLEEREERLRKRREEILEEKGFFNEWTL